MPPSKDGNGASLFRKYLKICSVPHGGTKVTTFPEATVKHFQPVLLASLITVLPSSLSAQGSPYQKLNGPLAPGGDVDWFYFSPDGTNVLYTADQDTRGVHELYSAALSGAGSTRLNTPLARGGQTWFHLVSPDGSTVVYTADPDGDGNWELYSAPVSGGQSTLLSHGLPPIRLGFDFQISPDGSTVVFVADRSARLDSYGLFRVPIRGGIPQRISHPFAEGRLVGQLRISPDNSTVVYTTNHRDEDYFDLYRVSLEGGASRMLSENALGVGTGVTDFQVSPDSQSVVYLNDIILPEVFSVSIDGGPSTRLNARELFPGGEVLDFEISPDSSTVVYRADQTERGVFGLYSVPLGGGQSTKLNESFLRNSHVYSLFKISPDSSTVVYRSDRDTPAMIELYSTPIHGGVSTKLNSPLVELGDVFESLITADGTRVIYLADQDTNNVDEIYSVPIWGGPSTRINAPLRAGAEILGFQLSQDDSTVAYLADHDVDEVFELHAVWVGRPEINLNVGRGLADAWRAEHFGAEDLANPWLEPTLWGWDADPDGDGLSNLIEYALGGIPLNTYTRELLEVSNGVVTMHFPQRLDALERGLNYVVEFSRDLENWSDVPPRGASDSLHDYRPPVDGFQVHVIEWPVTETRYFARLRVSFNRLQMAPRPFPFVPILPNLPDFP